MRHIRRPTIESTVPEAPRGHPKLQDSPGFYRRVLDHLPTPVIVIDQGGEITYANEAMVELTGWTFDEALGGSLFQYLHPDDATWVVEAFANLISTAEADEQLGASEWASLRLRVLAKDGTVIPIEATGGAGLTDPDVQGFMYSVRPARIEELLDAVFSGVASGDSIETLMQHVVDIMTLPPHGIEAAVFEQLSDGSDRLIAASHPAFEGLPMSCTDFVPWAGLHTAPARIAVEALPHPSREHLAAAGFRDCFYAGAHAPDVSTTLRLIACKRERQEPPMGALQRVERARELMSVVLLKAHNDRLLEHAATLDDLTGLPNRLGLSRCLRQIESSPGDCAMLFVDLDNFKLVNDLHGHLVGDRVLATVADRLRRAVRAGDVVTRLHGDEFALVLNGEAGGLTTSTLRRIANRVVKMLGEPVRIDGLTLTVSASVGVAHLDADRDIDRLMSRADEAMYAAKRAGGDRHQLAKISAA
jgi:diguanylate cyclase (GGDEF)-like protein/PAS domain S-box-containing protein